MSKEHPYYTKHWRGKNFNPLNPPRLILTCRTPTPHRCTLSRSAPPGLPAPPRCPNKRCRKTAPSLSPPALPLLRQLQFAAARRPLTLGAAGWRPPAPERAEASDTQGNWPGRRGWQRTSTRRGGESAIWWSRRSPPCWRGKCIR